MKKNSISIKKCRICDSNNIQNILDLGNQPLANNLQNSFINKEEFYPLIICQCKKCKTIQLTETVDPSKLFSNYLWVTGTSKVAKEYSKLFFKRASKYLKKDKSFIIEIASNDGTFLQPFKKAGYDVLGVDPAENIVKIANNAGINSISEFFGLKTAKKICKQKSKSDLIFARNVIPHVANVKDVIEGIFYGLKNDGIGIIEFHRADKILNELHYDSIYHEHLYYHSISSLSKLLEIYKLFPFDIHESPISGGSYVLYFSKNNKIKTNSLIEAELKEKNLGVNKFEKWNDFAKKASKHREKMINILNKVNSKNKTIVAYGASARSSTLLNYCGLTSKDITLIADRSEFKHDLLTPGSKIKIKSPEQVLATNPDIIILLAWNFKDEIITQLKEDFKWSGEVIIPLPQDPEIISI